MSAGSKAPDQFPGLIPMGGDFYMQIGKAAFSGVYTDTTSVPLRTQLDEITVGMAQVYDTYSPATDANDIHKYALFVDVAVSSGAIAIYRSSQGAVSGLPFNYILIGKKYTAPSG